MPSRAASPRPSRGSGRSPCAAAPRAVAPNRRARRHRRLPGAVVQGREGPSRPGQRLAWRRRRPATGHVPRRLSQGGDGGIRAIGQSCAPMCNHARRLNPLGRGFLSMAGCEYSPATAVRAGTLQVKRNRYRSACGSPAHAPYDTARSVDPNRPCLNFVDGFRTSAATSGHAQTTARCEHLARHTITASSHEAQPRTSRLSGDSKPLCARSHPSNPPHGNSASLPRAPTTSTLTSTPPTLKMAPSTIPTAPAGPFKSRGCRASTPDIARLSTTFRRRRPWTSAW